MTQKRSTKKQKNVRSPKCNVTKKQPTKKRNKNPLVWIKQLPGRTVQAVNGGFLRIRQRTIDFLRRRPHRSFRLTRRRDYKRSLKLPGYFAFTLYVTGTLWREKFTFLLLGITFFILMILFGMVGSQDIYSQLRDLMSDTAPDELFGGATGEIGKAGLILFTTLTSGLGGNIDTGQTILAGLLGLYVWLTVVWLLRNYLAGKRVKLRDGLYSAGAPLLPTLLMFIVLMIQLIPGAIVAIVASSAWQSGFIDGGAPAMAASIGLALVAVLSLYWITSTIIALVVVTLPGMYPFRALAIAGDLVIGRRLRILYRFIWMIVMVLSWWVVVMIPIILFDGWIKDVFTQIHWLPIVPVMLLLMSTATITWTAAYVYLLYRKVVDDDAAPA